MSVLPNLPLDTPASGQPSHTCTELKLHWHHLVALQLLPQSGALLHKWKFQNNRLELIIQTLNLFDEMQHIFRFSLSSVLSVPQHCEPVTLLIHLYQLDNIANSRKASADGLNRRFQEDIKKWWTRWQLQTSHFAAWKAAADTVDVFPLKYQWSGISACLKAKGKSTIIIKTNLSDSLTM